MKEWIKLDKKMDMKGARVNEADQRVDIMTHYKLWINGEWAESESENTISVTNPATETGIATVADGERVDAGKAIDAALFGSLVSPSCSDQNTGRFFDIFDLKFRKTVD